MFSNPSKHRLNIYKLLGRTLIAIFTLIDGAVVIPSPFVSKIKRMRQKLTSDFVSEGQIDYYRSFAPKNKQFETQ